MACLIHKFTIIMALFVCFFQRPIDFNDSGIKLMLKALEKLLGFFII